MISARKPRSGGGSPTNETKGNKAFDSPRRKTTMFKKIVVAVALVASLTLGPAAIRVRAQDSAPAKSAAETGEPGHSYRLDFTLNEIEDGKKINSRQYAMNLNSGDGS